MRVDEGASRCRLGVAAVAMMALCAIAAALDAGDDQHDSGSFCSVYRRAKQCITDPRCLWCGNVSLAPPNAFCHARNDTGACCNPPYSPSYECVQTARFCSASEMCIIVDDVNTFGECNLARCCPKGNPVACGYECYAAGWSCCGPFGDACNATQTCCGSFTGTCCAREQVCCESPDGYSNWCCAAGAQCTINGGCANP